MNRIPRLQGLPETPEERAMGEWFARQVLASPQALEAAARTIVSLVTALLGVHFGVMALSETPLPSFLWVDWMRPLGVIVVVALLAALLCALVVVLPLRFEVSSHRPDEQEKEFKKLLRRKSRWLTASVIAFAGGLVALGVVLIAALLTAV